MSATVPEERVDIVLADGVADVTAATRAVRSVSWVDAATLQCWLAGRGSMDVPAHCPGYTIPDGDSAHAFFYRVRPRYQTTRYAYSVVLTTPDAPVNAIVRIPEGGTSFTVPVSSPANARPTTIYFDRGAQSAGEDTLSLSVDPDGKGSDIRVDCISIEALPRAILGTTADDLGADRLAFWLRQPIMSPTLVTQVLGRQNELRDAARRTGLFQFSRSTSNPWTTTSGTPVGLFDGPVPIVPRRIIPALYRASARILARCSDGTTAGELSISNPTDGATIAIPLGTTSWVWLPSTSGDPASFELPSEDPAESDGIDSGWGEYEHTITFHRTAGAGTVQIASVSVFDAAQ